MRVVYVGFAALFVFAASLQYNDPDPARWMAIYLAAALAAGVAAAGRRAARPLAAFVGVVALIWAATYIPAVLRHGRVTSMFDEWTMRNAEVVQSRELFGLLIVVIAMTVIVWRPRITQGRTAVRRR